MSYKEVSKSTNLRLWCLVALMLCCTILLVGRLIYLHIQKQDFLQEQGSVRTIRTMPLPAFRGMITDRQGEPLAISTPVDSLWIVPKAVDWTEPGWRVVFDGLGMSPERVRYRIQKTKARDFFYLKRHLSPELVDTFEALKLKGLYVQREYRRYYPAGEVTAHVVGFTNIDDKGQEGLELAFNSWLSGQAGRQQILRDRMGHSVEGLHLQQKPQDGQHLVLSLDKRLQYMAYRALRLAMKQHQAKAGSVIMLDVETGEVLAMVNYPAYNPNQRHRKIDSRLRNRAVTDMFEPGSVIKAISMAHVLENGDYPAHYQVQTAPGWLKVGGQTIKDVRNYGEIDFQTIIQKSSNVGIAKLAMNLPVEPFIELLMDFGFGQKTHSGFPGESPGKLPYPARWRTADIATLSFGYGLAVTPLQLASAYATIASDGLRRDVSFLKQQHVAMGQQIISPRVAAQLKEMLHTVTTTGGTGRQARVLGYDIAGKTGTVKKMTAQGYADDQYVAVFAGFAPKDVPKIATVVVIDTPTQGQYYGGQVAAPVFAEIMSGALRILNVPN